MRGFIQELLEQELTAALGRKRCERAAGEPKGYRNGTRERQLLGSFGPVEVEVPRARMAAADGGTQEWRSTALPRYARMTRQVEALIAGAYLVGTNTRRVKRTLGRWLGRWRRLSRDCEHLPEVSEAMVTLAIIRLRVHRAVYPNRKRLPAPSSETSFKENVTAAARVAPVVSTGRPSARRA